MDFEQPFEGSGIESGSRENVMRQLTLLASDIADVRAYIENPNGELTREQAENALHVLEAKVAALTAVLGGKSKLN